MDAQRHYWETFTTLKRNAIYISRYQGWVEKAERRINMFSAIAASGAIGGWVIWQHLSFLWAVVIAAAQVLNAVKPYLPYRARLAALSRLAPDLEALALAAETDWFKVSRGVLTENEIFELAMTLKRKVQQTTQKHFKGSSLPEDKRLLAMADRDVDTYMIGFRED